jgi:hypothetical protein
MPNPYLIIAVLLALAGSLFGGYEYGEHVQRTADQVAADQLKIDAAAQLQSQTAKVDTLNQTLAEASNKAEKDALDHAQALKDIAARSGAAVAAAGGLHDPGRRGVGGGCPASHAPGTAADHAGAATAARLSDELTGFLFREADRADQVVVRLQACENYSTELRAAVNGGGQ